MNYDKAKARLGQANDHADDPVQDTIITVLTQLLETVEIHEARLDDQGRQMVRMAEEIAHIAKNLTGTLEVLDTLVSRSTRANS